MKAAVSPCTPDRKFASILLRRRTAVIVPNRFVSRLLNDRGQEFRMVAFLPCVAPSDAPERLHETSPCQPVSAAGQSHFRSLATPCDFPARRHHGRRGCGGARIARRP